MYFKGFLILISYLLLNSCSSQLNLVNPTITPHPSDQVQSDLIKEGIILHDKGKYDDALEKYKESIKLNSQNVWALYEMSYTYSVLKQYDQSLETCKEAVKYKSPYLPSIYIQMGTSYDNIQEPKKSIKVYEKGIELYPDNYLLHFNLGITQINNKNSIEAKKCFKSSAILKSDHSSSHIALGEIYFNENYRIPSLLAYFRFLVLEPSSQRSSSAMENIQILMGSGVEAKDETLKEINLFIPSDTPIDDGDFGAVDLGLTMSRATRFTEDSKGKSEVEMLKSEMESLFQLMYELEENEKHKGFGWEYYAPYFMELKQKGFIDPFVNHIFSASNLPEIINWIKANQNKYQAFLEWSKNYQFVSSI